MIEYRNVWKAYDAPVLTGVDLRVEEGEMFGIFGPSGTGKSVLLKTTIGLIPLDRGDVRVAGKSASRSIRTPASAHATHHSSDPNSPTCSTSAPCAIPLPLTASVAPL